MNKKTFEICDKLSKMPAIERSFCYILIKPDVTIRRIIKSIFNYIINAGFELLDYCYGSLTEASFSLMYEKSFKWESAFWAHNIKMYRFGPVIAALLWYPTSLSNYSSAHSYLLSIKGSPVPKNLKLGQLRTQFCPTNTLYNIIHIPDDITQSLLEASTWFNTSYLERLLKLRSNQTEATRSQNSLKRLLYEGSIHRYFSDQMLDGALSYNLLKIRFLHSLEKQINPSKYIRRTLYSMKHIYSFYCGEIIRNKMNVKDEKIDKIMHELHHLNKIIINYLEENNLLDFPKRTFQLLTYLDSKGKKEASSLDFLWYTMKKWKVYVSDLEKYLIDTHFLYLD
jgi:nucleoside diphosphate kinase